MLQVTPPATITPTPAPATMTPTSTQVTPSLTPTLVPTDLDISPTVISELPSSTGRSPFGWLALIGVMIIALILVAIFARRRMAIILKNNPPSCLRRGISKQDHSRGQKALLENLMRRSTV